MGEQVSSSGDKHQLDPLEERIELAIQPVIADFQQHVVEVVEQRLASAQTEDETATKRDATEQETAAGPDDTEEAATSERDATEDGTTRERDESEPKVDADAGADGHRGGGLAPVVRQTLIGLEHQSGEWLQSLVTVALGALFSNGVRAVLEKQLDDTVHELLADVFSGLPPDAEKSDKLRDRTERTTRELLDEMLTEIFEGSVRREVEFHGDEAVQAASRLDFDTAVRHGKDALEALVLGLVRVLGRHWGEIIRLLLRIVIESLQESFSSTAIEGFSNVVASKDEAEEKGEQLQEQFKEKTTELGEKLRETSETLRQRVSEQTENLQKRLKDGVDNGTGNRQLGRPPSGGPLGRAPSGRPSGPGKLGRAPGTRAPGGPKSRR